MSLAPLPLALAALTLHAVGKMGLKGTPGLNIVKELPPIGGGAPRGGGGAARGGGAPRGGRGGGQQQARTGGQQQPQQNGFGAERADPAAHRRDRRGAGAPIGGGRGGRGGHTRPA